MFIDNGARYGEHRDAGLATERSTTTRPHMSRTQLESDRQLTGSVPRTGARCTPRAEPRERTATSAVKNRQLHESILSRQSFSSFLPICREIILNDSFPLPFPFSTFHATSRRRLEKFALYPLGLLFVIYLSPARLCLALAHSSNPLRLQCPVRWRFVPERREHCQSFHLQTQAANVKSTEVNSGNFFSTIVIRERWVSPFGFFRSSVSFSRGGVKLGSFFVNCAHAFYKIRSTSTPRLRPS